MAQQLTAPRPGAASRTNRTPGPTAYVWLVWRQHGGAIVAACVLTLLICTALLFAGPMLSGLHCTGSPYDLTFNGASSPNSCGDAAATNMHLYQVSLWLVRATVFAPLVFGVFWGAPLVSREYETGTDVLAWGQGISAQQWLRGKLFVLATLATLLCLAMWACAHPVVGSMARLAPFEFGGRFGWEAFDTLVPLTVPYALVALAVGVLASVLIKRTLPAMVGATVVCAGLGMGTADLLRPHYESPVVAHYPSSLDAPPFSADALYLVYNAWADAAGHPTGYFPRQCTQPSDPCLSEHGITGRVSVYQPGSREGAFQAIEATLALLLAAGLGSFAVRRTAAVR